MGFLERRQGGQAVVSLEAHHKFILDMVARQDAIARKYVAELEAENARLKAEVERLTSVSEAWKKRRLDKVEAECINWADVENENASLKAEVAHLQSENLLVREESDRHYQLWVNRGHEIERLRRLGTEMGKHLPDTDEANQAYLDFEAGGRQ
jgi:cell division protein FtsB